MIGQLLIAQPIIVIVLVKAAIFHRGFELGIEWAVMKWTLLDFGFSLSKKQKIVEAEEQENEKEVVSVEDVCQVAENVSFGASMSILAVLEKFQTSCLAKLCLTHEIEVHCHLQ